LMPTLKRTFFPINAPDQEKTNCCGSSSGNCLLLPRNQSALSIPHFHRDTTLLKMASSGTMRGTPKGRGTVPAFANSPASSIPRPAYETHASGSQSEAGGSTMSASRQKQSKRDEVCLEGFLSFPCWDKLIIYLIGYSEEDRDGSQQEETYYWQSTANKKGSPWNCPCPSSESSSPDQTEYYCCGGCTIDGSKEGRLCTCHRR
jgi:hypothetical protein